MFSDIFSKGFEFDISAGDHKQGKKERIPDELHD